MRRVLRFAAAGAAALAVACGNGDDTPTPTLAQSPTVTPTATITVPGIASDTPTSTATPPTPGPTPTPSPTPDPGPLAVALEEVARGFARPTFVTGAGDGSDRLFVVEKRGTIQVLRAGAPSAAPFLDVTDLVNDGGSEQGLLGLAFHPDYAANGRFFVAYTANNGANTLAEIRVSTADPDRADPATLRVLLALPDSRPNHNGGMVAFGPDGYLYFSTGDGGGGGDPDGAGQDLGTMMAKILRLDVDGGEPYAIPPDNPFAATAGARPETWAYGLRNPWRFSFDRETGDLWIADVGQNAREEINLQLASSPGGENYGWSIMEGSSCYRPASGCDTAGKVLPLYDYDHASGCSVTGGYVYRGAAIPALRGLYVFADYCAGDLIALAASGEATSLDLRVATVSSFGEDDAGEVYVVSDSGGAIYRLANAAP